MLLSNLPARILTAFAASGNKRTVPVPSQIGITPGAASFTDGFPPLNGTPIASGGIPPDIRDMNGALYPHSLIQQWQCGGGLFSYDSTWSTDNSGYPKGALLLKADGTGYWQNLVDGNTTNPDASGTGWGALFGNAVGAWFTSADGQNRLYFVNNDATIINGLGSTPVQIRSGVSTLFTVKSSGVVSSGADAVASGDLVRLDQISRIGHTYGTSDWYWVDEAQGLFAQYFVGSYTGASDSTQDINLPIAFPTQCTFALGNIGSNMADRIIGAQYITGNSAKVRVGYHSASGSAASAIGYSVLAIGY